MRYVVDLVTKWGVEKGIIEKRTDGEFFGSTIAQLKKCGEEVIESMESYWLGAPDELELELGDIGVTWIMSCRASGFDPEDCLAKAYQKIRDRKGEMKDGQFVKEEANE